MNLIKLTNSKDGESIYINPRWIVSFRSPPPVHSGKCKWLTELTTFGRQEYIEQTIEHIYVTESPKQIVELISKSQEPTQ